jgi:hypothetical protein
VSKYTLDINARFILLHGMLQPENKRIGYWTKQQIESNYSPSVFWDQLVREYNLIRSWMDYNKKEKYIYEDKYLDSKIKSCFNYSHLDEIKFWLEEYSEHLDEEVAKSTSIQDNLPSFKDYLTDEGIKIFPWLKANYSNHKSKDIAYMLFALNDLTTLLKPTAMKNLAKLHRALTNTFSVTIGGRESLRQNIKRLTYNADDYDHEEIELHRKKIREAANLN